MLTARVQQDSQNAVLYLRRGELHSRHGDWEAALADFAQAAELDPTLDLVELARGKTLLKAGRFSQAQRALNRFLANHSDHAEARIARARVLVKLGENQAAVEDYTRGISQWEKLGRPTPELYLERAPALLAQGPEQVGEALRGLDQGIEKLGPLPALQLYAIELELARRQYDAALTRLATLSAQSPRQEIWWVRRGEILEQAGRSMDARLAYEQALVALERLRGRHRSTRATAELEEKVRAALTRLEVNTSPEVQP